MFRIFNKSKKIIEENIFIGADGLYRSSLFGLEPLNSRDFVIDIFTGLQDKNSVKIFTGDDVFNHAVKTKFCVIQYRDGFYLGDLESRDPLLKLGDFIAQVEVIGLYGELLK